MGLLFMFSCFPKYETLLKENVNGIKILQLENNTVIKSDDIQEAEMNINEAIDNVDDSKTKQSRLLNKSFKVKFYGLYIF